MFKMGMRTELIHQGLNRIQALGLEILCATSQLLQMRETPKDTPP